MKILTEEEMGKRRKETYYPIFQIILEQVKEHNDCKTIVETGLGWGRNAFILLKVFPNAKYCGYDSYGGIRIYDEEMARKLFETYPNVKITKTEYPDIKEFPKADLVHIDGDHNVICCSHDLELAVKCLNKNGVILVNIMVSNAVKRVVDGWYEKNKEEFNLHIFNVEYKWAMIWRGEN